MYHSRVSLLNQFHSSLSYTDLSAHCALLLQECIKCRYIHNHLFESYSILKPLFTKYAYSSHFDTCSDVLQIIYTLLRINKQTIINSVNPDNPLCSDVPKFFFWMMCSCLNGWDGWSRVIIMLQFACRYPYCIENEYQVDFGRTTYGSSKHEYFTTVHGRYSEYPDYHESSMFPL